MKSDPRTPASDAPPPSRETVLLAVTGKVPSVLTETVWALAHEAPPIVPGRVVAITTRPGRKAIEEELFTPLPAFGKRTVWESLSESLREEGKPVEGRLRFGTTGSDIRVVTCGSPGSARSQELDDIRTPEESAAAADFILEQVRAFVENPEVSVVASVAGGRKTMGALLFGCMSLVGRETDRITHVLVNDPFDGMTTPRFYFPKQPAQRLRTADGTTVRAADAEIALADIPFVPLRNRLLELDEQPGNYMTAVRRFSRLLGKETGPQPVVALHPERGIVCVDDVSIPLRRRAFLTLEFLIEHQDKLPYGQKEAVDVFRKFLEEHPHAYAQRWAPSPALGDDLKRELSYLRWEFRRFGVRWGPGLRQDSMRLPPFVLARTPGKSCTRAR